MIVLETYFLPVRHYGVAVICTLRLVAVASIDRSLGERFVRAQLSSRPHL